MCLKKGDLQLIFSWACKSVVPSLKTKLHFYVHTKLELKCFNEVVGKSPAHFDGFGSRLLTLDQQSISRRLFLCSDTYCSLKDFVDLSFQRLFYNSYLFMLCYHLRILVQIRVLTDEDSVSTE